MRGAEFLMAGLAGLIFLTSLAIFIWAIVLLAKYGKTIPTWALILGIVFLFSSGPAFTIALVYFTKGMKKKIKNRIERNTFIMDEFPSIIRRCFFLYIPCPVF